MVDRKTVNIDYLCVIREKAGKTSFETIDIPASVELVGKLEGMAENENATILDMQAQMANAFLPSERRDINYVSPHSYGSAFINTARYPASLTNQSFREKLLEIQDRAEKDFEARNASLKAKDPKEFSRQLGEHLESEVKALKRNLKRLYLDNAKRYICAYNYTETLGEARKQGDVRMYSTDTLGFSSFSYKVTEDISINLHTNFGYGSASYFHLNVRYKGIDILPYSYLVKYYWANRRDLIRYTRLYDVAHDSWNTSFDFVEQLANLASTSPQEFINKWILNEVKEMVYGLHGILEDPKFHLREMLNRNGLRAVDDYLTVRNMSIDERSRYAVYPEEMTMAVQAEKITGALDFLGNLSALSELIPDIDGFISEIKNMAVAIIPKLDAMRKAILTKLELRQQDKAAKEANLAVIKKSLEPHEKKIDALYEKRSGDKAYWTRLTFENDYKKSNAQYATLRNRASELNDQIDKLIREIFLRKKFEENLMECRKRVSDAGLIEALKEAA